VIFGPHTANCAAMAEALTAADGAEVVLNQDALAAALARLLTDKKLRARRMQNAAVVAASGLGTLDAVLSHLAPWLDALLPPRQLETRRAANANARP